MQKSNWIVKLFETLLSEKKKETVEKITLVIAIGSYLAHLLVILLNTQGVINIEQKFFKNPIAAIYTPFSFILLFEIFLLVYYLPKSISIYIGKQYEIITLIVIRRIFKDIAYVELDSNWFQNKNDLQFTLDVVTSLILFFLIFLFYRAILKRDYVSITKSDAIGDNMRKFVLLKQLIAVILVPLLVVLAAYTFINWGIITFRDYSNGILEFSKINNVFYDEFFTILIVIDVLLLLSSFFHSDKFYKIIRNSGFVISTILLKISFLSVGVVSNVLVISSVLFGYLILVIHNLYEKNAVPHDE
jgi:hypothetical protein